MCAIVASPLPFVGDWSLATGVFASAVSGVAYLMLSWGIWLEGSGKYCDFIMVELRSTRPLEAYLVFSRQDYSEISEIPQVIFYSTVESPNEAV